METDINEFVEYEWNRFVTSFKISLDEFPPNTNAGDKMLGWANFLPREVKETFARLAYENYSGGDGMDALFHSPKAEVRTRKINGRDSGT